MKTLERHKQFSKNFRKAKLTDQQFQKFVDYVNKLINGENLPLEANDHSLEGKLKGSRDLHLGGDMVLIYIKTDAKIILSRIGSHAQLFKES